MKTAVGIFWIVVAVLDALAIGRAVYRAQGVERTLMWIFAILAFPGLGSLAYFALAGPSLKRTTRRRRALRASFRSRLAECQEPETGSDATPAAALSAADVETTGPAGPVLAVAAEVTGLPASSGNRVSLMAEDAQAFEEIEHTLLAAQRSIWAEYYIIRNDETGQRFLDLLAQRVRDGIEVRLLYDAIGSLGLDPERLETITQAGGRAEDFMPMNPLRRRWSLDLRNHRKLVLVDGQVAFTGGMNVGDDFSGRSRRRGRTHFHDTHLCIRGPAVYDLALTFAEDWCFAAGEALDLPPRPGPQPGSAGVVAVVPSGPDQEFNANGLVYFTGITSARERLYLSTPYFIPDEPTLRALVSAGLRGIDVRLLLPGPCDVAVVRAAARTYYPLLLGSGVRLFEYQPSMLHAKTMTGDGAWAVVGSANVDIRSFQRNFELSALVADPPFAGLVEERFFNDLANSVEITEETVAQVGLWERVRSRTARLLSPLL